MSARSMFLFPAGMMAGALIAIGGFTIGMHHFDGGSAIPSVLRPGPQQVKMGEAFTVDDDYQVQPGWKFQGKQTMTIDAKVKNATGGTVDGASFTFWFMRGDDSIAASVYCSSEPMTSGQIAVLDCHSYREFTTLYDRIQMDPY